MTPAEERQRGLEHLLDLVCDAAFLAGELASSATSGADQSTLLIVGRNLSTEAARVRRVIDGDVR